MWVYIKIFLQYLFFVALLEVAMVVLFYIFGGVLPMFEEISGTAIFAVPIILIGLMVLSSVKRRQERKYDGEQETISTAAFVAQVVFEVMALVAVAITAGLLTAFWVNQ